VPADIDGDGDIDLFICPAAQTARTAPAFTNGRKFI
jgi:hypothetical protein